MRYIRFLKPPTLIAPSNSSSKSRISCLITITSDLGESFFPYDLNLCVELWSRDREEEAKVLCHATCHWKAGMRTVPISVEIPRASFSRPDTWPLKLHISVESRTSSDQWTHLFHENLARGVISAWSADIHPDIGNGKVSRMVERRIEYGKTLHIWEETGESIARHLWDAGVTTACHISQLSDSLLDVKTPLTEALGPALGEEQVKPFRVLELGTGCGIVGISIAQIVPNAEVILTDLDEAKEIVEWNMTYANADLAPGSSLSFRELVWGEKIPKGLNGLDLVIAADCTYNADSSPALVDTLQRLAKASPGVNVVIAMKRRHSSEEVFFSLMSDAGFKTGNDTTDNKMTIPLPEDEGNGLGGEETVEIYLYRYPGRS